MEGSARQARVRKNADRKRYARHLPSAHYARLRAEFRAISRRDSGLVGALEELIEILGEDPYNRAGRHQIKKLAGLKPGEGQWRVRWRDYRLRYDIFGSEVVLHSFRHRKDAY